MFLCGLIRFNGSLYVRMTWVNLFRNISLNFGFDSIILTVLNGNRARRMLCEVRGECIELFDSSACLIRRGRLTYCTALA